MVGVARKLTEQSYTPLLDDGERLSVDALRALQLERLQWSMRHAYDNCQPYRAKCAAKGVHPDDLKRLEDLRHFPFTTKQDLRDHYPFGFFAVPQEKVARIHASSGTTGRPTVVGYTQHDIDVWADLVARSIRAAGGRPGMKVHVAYGYGLFTGGLGAHYGAERLGCAVIPMSGGHSQKQIQLITDFQPDIIMVTPSYLLALLDEFRRQDLSAQESSLKIGILGAEPWTNEMRREIEQAYAMDAVDIYGLSEVMGPGVANECVETKDGLTIWEDFFYPEIIDPHTEEPVADGEVGELVFTTLTKEAMPVMRYRTRDLTRLLPGTARHMRRMDRITGRSDDMMVIRGVNVFPSQIEELILAIDGLAPHYALEISRPEHLDLLRVEVESCPISGEGHQDRCAATLRERIKTMIGISANVDVVAPETLPRSTGKAARVRDVRGLQKNM
jgi:phenylacetate-CoA ligase